MGNTHDDDDPGRKRSLIQRYPVASYFALVFSISWAGAFVMAGPSLTRSEALPQLRRLLMFPIMLIGPSTVGLVLTWVVAGRAALKDLGLRMLRIRVPLGWYAVLLIPPALVLTVLICLERFVSVVFAPNTFLVGMAFGLVAGFLEEIGWMGYAFPKMRQTRSAVSAALMLGLLWSAWHLPVIDNLGTATPHGSYWLPYFLAFTGVMVGMRILIAWLYSNTNSVLLAQLMHASSTGSLVVFSPSHITAAQEVLWYAVYASVVWITVGLVLVIYGRDLVLRREFNSFGQPRRET